MHRGKAPSIRTGSVQMLTKLDPIPSSECCCGKCSPSMILTCMRRETESQGTWEGFHTDFCFRPPGICKQGVIEYLDCISYFVHPHQTPKQAASLVTRSTPESPTAAPRTSDQSAAVIDLKTLKESSVMKKNLNQYIKIQEKYTI